MDLKEAVREWQPLARQVSPAFDAARLQAHWAVQLVGAVGAAFLQPRPDFSHTSLTWDAATAAFVGEPLENGSRASLHLPSLTLALRDSGAAEPARLALAGHTLAEGLAWLEEVSRPLMGPPARPLALLDHDLPAHPLAAGARFAPPDGGHSEELCRWFGNAARLATAVGAAAAGASPVRCWPHHFDMATLITLDREEPDAEKARSIGFGMTPGDASYGEPYFYVNLWPQPTSADALPALSGGGQWHRTGWIGAVLVASRLASSKAGDQGRQVEAFVRSALPAARSLLQG